MLLRLALLIACWHVSLFCYSQDIPPLHLYHTTLGKIIDTLEVMGHCEISCLPKYKKYNRIDLDIGHGTVSEALTMAIRAFPFHLQVLNIYGRPYYDLQHIDNLPLTGVVLDDKNKPIEDVQITVKNTVNSCVTGRNGTFRLTGVPDSAILVTSGINVGNSLWPTGGRIYLELRVSRKIYSYNSVTVTSSFYNGFGPQLAIHNPASYYTVDKPTLDRIIAPNITDHFANQASGLTSGGPGNTLGVAIRDRNTLYGTGTPLFVLDNFIFFGNSGDINPNDIESATILKDAVAASVWGAFSGNGVIVLSSRAGHYHQHPKWTVTANTTIAAKPNLGYQPRLGSASYIGMEENLFSQHFFDGAFADPTHPLTPVVNLLEQQKLGILPPGFAGSLIGQMAGHSIVSDLQKYFYRGSASQEWHACVDGGTLKSRYYFSGGYDYDPTALVRNNYQRYTLHGNYTGKVSPKLEYALTLNFVDVTSRINNPGTVPVAYPYAALANAAGQPLAVPYEYNQNYIDTAGGGRLEPWDYRPLQELRLADNRTGRLSAYGQAMLKYSFTSDLSLSLYYRYMRGHSFDRDLYSKDGFFVRDLVNQFAQIGGSAARFLVPPGNILVSSDTDYTAHNARAQLSFLPSSYHDNQWVFLLGTELSDLTTTGQTNRIYGYTGHGNGALMDLVNKYPNYITGDSIQIPTDTGSIGLSNRYLSGYANASYTFRKLTTLYASFRMDATNVVGLQPGRQWTPFWAAGLSRELIRSASRAGASQGQGEAFTPLLKLRATYGSNGNVSNRTANMVITELGNNNYGAPQSGIVNPADPSLTMERVYVLNLAVDFSLLRDKADSQGRIFGSLDFYHKHAVNLLSNDTLAPSYGVPVFLGNTAAISGGGFDLVLHSVNTRGRVKWWSTLLLSAAKDQVSRYGFQPLSPLSYVSGGYPMKGRSSTALFTYRSGGLDPLHGNPQGYIAGQLSENYYSIMTNSQGGFHYSGSYQPEIYGSLLNSFSWNRLSLSTRITYRGLYYFKRSSIDYNALLNGLYPGHRDYDRRWISTTDQNKTSVPSYPQIDDPNRDAFYLNSDALITKADNIRWQDLRVSYEFPKAKLVVYLYVNNLCILWKANHEGIDPDAAVYGQLPAVRTFSTGLRLDL